MKSLTLGAVALLALLAMGSTKHIESQFATKDFLIKQKFMLEMFQHIYQDDVFIQKYDETYINYKPWEHTDDYNKIDLFKSFFELWQNKPFLDDEVFSIMYERHTEYAIGLVRLFHYAKDWNSFTHAVYWARTHVNKQLFIYSLTVATLFRPDLEGVVLPAIYEIHPWYFFDTDTLEMAEKYKMHGFHKVKTHDNMYNVVIKTNYSNVYGDMNYDHSLAYFLEDLGLNSFYYYFNMDYPAWSHGPEERSLNKDRRGEFYLYVHQQLLARYYLERLSNGLGEIETLNIFEPIENGYYNNLRYYPGVAFPNRENHYTYTAGENIEDVWDSKIIAHRIADYIDRNQKDYMEGVNELGNMLQGNVDSINLKYYGSFDRIFRHMLSHGRQYGKYHEELPSTFMHYETSVRDPLFFQMYKNIMSFYYHFTGTFPEYTHKDLNFEGVKIEKIHMPDSLSTYFEYFDADISNVVNVEVPSEETEDTLVKFGRNSHYEGKSFVIKARQYRLNHVPFEFELDVISDKAQQAVVKVFVGPKYDENGKVMYLEDNYMNFFELDHFLVDLVVGSNAIKRNSIDFTWYVNDRTTYLELYQKTMDAMHTDYQFPLNQMEAHCGIPNRLMLPKGTDGGMNVQFFYMVYAYHEPTVKQYTGYNPTINCGIGYGSRYVDALPFGYPFNRPVKHGYYFNVDNMKFYDTKIYHKEDHSNVVE